MVLTNTAESKTVITTTSQQAPLVQQPVMAPVVNTIKQMPVVNTINKEAIITNVMEKPILENVIEKKNVEVHHKNVIQEIHEQKIIEIEKQPMIQQVNKGTIVEQQKAATRFEEIGTGAIGEQERLRLEQLRLTSAPKIVQQQGAVRQINENELVQEVVRQEFIERHVQPVITEVRSQNIVQEVVHPVVRKIHEAPIIREVTSSSAQFTQLSDVEFRERYHRGFPFELASSWQRPTHMNETEWTQWRTSSQQAGMFARPQTGFTDQQWRQWYDHNSRLSTNTGFINQQSTLPMTTQQTGLINQQSMTTQKPGLVQNVKEHLHMNQTQTGLTQQSGLINQQSTLPMNTQAPLTGSTLPLNNQAPLMSTRPLQSNLGGHNVVTTTNSSGVHATTSTTGAPILAERNNMMQHEGKVLAQEGGMLTKVEQANLNQHEKVVDTFVHGNLAQGNFNSVPGSTINKAPLGTGLNNNAPLKTAPLTTTAPLNTTTQQTQPFGKPLDDDAQKPGLMTRLKEKMHRNK